MKKYLLIGGAIFPITLAIVVGVRMSSDAMAVIIGIIFGLLASVPTSLMLVWTLRQRDKQLEAQFQGRSPGQYPPVVVVNGQPNGYGNGFQAPPLPSVSSAGSREFKVVGQDNTETVGDVLPAFWDEL